jgi:superfamily II DNA or RNA helicase
LFSTRKIGCERQQKSKRKLQQTRMEKQHKVLTDYYLYSLRNTFKGARQNRGYDYFKKKRVRDFRPQSAGLNANVLGSEKRMYDVSIRFQFPDNFDVLPLLPFLENPASQAFPRDFWPRFFSFLQHDARIFCQCADQNTMCKHAVATLFEWGRQLNENPRMLLEVFHPWFSNLTQSLKGDERKFFPFDHLTDIPDELSSEGFIFDSSLFLNIPQGFPEQAFQALLSFTKEEGYSDSNKEHTLQAYYSIMRLVGEGVFSPTGIPEKTMPAGDLQWIATADMRDEIWQFLSKDDDFPETVYDIPEFLSFTFPYLNWTAEDKGEEDELWMQIFRFAGGLIRIGAFMPSLEEVGPEQEKIRWVPMGCTPALHKAIAHMEAAIPDSFILFLEQNEDAFYLKRGKRFSFMFSRIVYHLLYLQGLSPHRVANTKAKVAMGLEVFRSDVQWEKEAFRKAFSFFLPIFSEGVPEIQVIWNENEQKVEVSVRFLPYSGRPRLLNTITYSHLPEEPLYLQQLFKLLQKIDSRLWRKEQPFSALVKDPAWLKEWNEQTRKHYEQLGFRILIPRPLPEVVDLLAEGWIDMDSDEQSKGWGSLTFEWRLTVGGKPISFPAVRKLIKDSDGLIRYNNKLIHVNRQEAERLLIWLEKHKPIKSSEILHTALSGNRYGLPVSRTKQVKYWINALRNSKNVPTPKGLQARLRPYQYKGYLWLYKNMRMGFGSLLADDMGLGKTLQVLTFLLKIKEEKRIEEQKVLVVVPAGLMYNWQAEAVKFTPALKTYLYHGGDRDIKSALANDLIITTYGTLRSDEETLSSILWSCVIFDEAQQLKNPSTGQTKAARNIKSAYTIAMTGTPVENRLLEMWSIMEQINPEYLGGRQSFEYDWAKPIEQNQDSITLNNFRSIISPFILRRVKTDKNIIQDLPDKLIFNKYAHLTPTQSKLYNDFMEEMLQEVEEMDGISRKGNVLKLLTGLKQICNHPSLHSGRPAESLEESGKGALLMDILQQIHEAGEKTLIFTQYTQWGEMLIPFLKAQFGEAPAYLHGGLNAKQRQQQIEKFESEDGPFIFLLSLKAGGTGLNLVKATHVIHYDLWWNPAVENQATDRAFRIGQTKNVMVHRLINKGTLEERIDSMLQQKSRLADLTVKSGEQWIGDLTNSELRQLLTLRD